MRVPLSWLSNYVDINLPTNELTERLTLAGLEVAGVEQVGDWWDPETIVVGEVVAILPHPDADRLVLVDVHYGGQEPQRVVTGAPNLFAYRDATALPVLKVAFAREGAVLVDAYSDKSPRPKKKLKASKIRGVRSAGMVCSERELGISEEHEGIIVLPDDAPVGTSLASYLHDAIVEIELTPDMARCLSMIGVAREVAALTEAPLHLPADEWQPSGDDSAEEYVAVEVADPELCHRYTAVLIKDVTIGPSPSWMQQRLTQAGMRPINNIVDITNYIMLEWGQPLHAFDYDILVERARRVGDSRPTIIVKRAAANEKFTTLDDVNRTLDESMLMITDTAGSVAIAGVMGGQESEVSETTTNILLESATFEGINNRRTSAQLRLPSEASYRFARGVPATLNPLAARHAAELMRQYAGGRIVPGMVDTYPVAQKEPIVYTTVSDMRRLLGMDVSAEQIVDALQRLDFTVEQVHEVRTDAPADATFALHRDEGEILIEAIPPWHRLDIAIPADLVEEVARVIGYEHVGTTLINDALPAQRRNELFQTEETVRDILMAIGLQENINHPLTTPENHEKLNAPHIVQTEDGRPATYVTVANPSVPEKRSMRRSMFVSVLENLARNLRYTDRLMSFEVGRIYLPEKGDDLLPFEDRRVSICITGPRQLSAFQTINEPTAEMDFFDLKGIVEALLQRLGFVSEHIEFRAQPDTGVFGPRCAELFVNGESIGLLGEIHPQVRAAFGVSAARIGAAELRLLPLLKPHWELQPMQPISTYPPVVEDLAFEVAEMITAQDVKQAIQQGGDERLVAVDLFDIYRGEPLAVGHKSMAYRLTYQSMQRSMNEKEVGHLRQRIIKTVEKQTGGKLRG